MSTFHATFSYAFITTIDLPDHVSIIGADKGSYRSAIECSLFSTIRYSLIYSNFTSNMSSISTAFFAAIGDTFYLPDKAAV